MHGLAELIGNPWLYVLVGLFIIIRNVFGAFPEPNPAIATGFGSGSPGYKFLYQIARGMTGDLNAIGMNLKGAVAARLPSLPPDTKPKDTP